MKIFSLVLLAAILSGSAFAAEPVLGKARAVITSDPYHEMPSTMRSDALHEAKLAAIVSAMELCKSETVSRLNPWRVIEDLHQPTCVQYYDGCRMDSDRVLTIDVDAQFSCLPGPIPDLNDFR